MAFGKTPLRIEHIMRNTFVFMALAMVLTSCSTYRYNMMNPYLESVKDIKLEKYPEPFKEVVLKPDEVVKVTFAGENEKVSGMLNRYGGAELETDLGNSKGTGRVAGQQINKEGYIEFPYIGKVKAADLTKIELQEYLKKAVEPYLKNPLVLVETPLRGVTFIGQVRSPSTVSFPKEHANLFEMLAEVGFTAEYADMGEVKIYRQNNDGSREIGHLDLNGKDFLDSKYFYPLPSDVVYIPASKERAVRNLTTTVVPFVSVILAITSLLLTFTR